MFRISRSSTLAALVAASLVGVSVLPTAAQAANQYPDNATAYTQDKQWMIQMHAFTDNWIIYHSIGTEITVYHRERERRWYDPWYNFYHWVARPAAHIEIYNQYQSAVGTRQISTPYLYNSFNQSHAEAKLVSWGPVGINVSCTADYSSCSVNPSVAFASSLGVSSVIGNAIVSITGEPDVGLGLVQSH